MTLTNGPFADSPQVPQPSMEAGERSHSAPSHSAPSHSAPVVGGESPGGMSGARSLTPQQQTARLVELESLIAAASGAEELLIPLHQEKASLLFAAQDYAAAVMAWDQALALQPKQARIWYNRGIALDRQGAFALALSSYDRVIELEPGNHIAWGNRAIALRKLGRDSEAREAARIAFELNPEDMVDSFFQQLRQKQPKLGFVLGPLQGLVQRLRR